MSYKVTDNQKNNKHPCHPLDKQLAKSAKKHVAPTPKMDFMTEAARQMHFNIGKAWWQGWRITALQNMEYFYAAKH